MYFEEYINFKIICYLRRCVVYLLKLLEVMYTPSHPD
jgi:hypothetical protein